MKSERKTVNYEMTMKNMKRENLLEKLRKEGRFVENPCNGKGICGKCKVKILSGDAGKVTETERRFLSEEELAQWNPAFLYGLSGRRIRSGNLAEREKD